VSSAKWSVVVLSVAALVALSQGGCPTPTPKPTVTGDATAGGTLFDVRCIGCHNPASTIAAARNVITNNMGTLDAAMNGITLTDQEIADLKAFLATQTATALTGDVAAGSQLFAARCTGCHGAASNVPEDLVTNNLGTIDPAMAGITLTDQEVADLQAFLATQ
jgi:mono/diheme cytochrome c family protein